MGTGEKMTIDDLYEVFVNALYDPVTGKRTKDTRDGLRAVLETHVKPLLAEAWNAGRDRGQGLTYLVTTRSTAANDYASSVIHSLTQEPSRDV